MAEKWGLQERRKRIPTILIDSGVVSVPDMETPVFDIRTKR
jgi:hypothetical protein